MPKLVAKGGFYPDVLRSCRTCFNHCGTIPIFPSEEPDFEGCTLRDLITSFANVEISEDDGLPSKICMVCLTGINMALKLKAQCQYADSFWREYILASDDEGAGGCWEEIGPEELAGKGIAPSPPPEETEGEGVTGNFLIRGAVKEPNVCDLANQETTEDVATSSGFTCHVVDGKVQWRRSKQENIIACPLCKKGYLSNHGSNRHLVQHLWNDHEPTGEYPCKYCGKILPLKELLKLHEEEHTAKKPLICSQCGLGFKLIHHLKCHERRHRRPDSRSSCRDCGEPYRYSKADHVCVLVNPNMEKTHLCDFCGKKYLKPSQLRWHRMTYHLNQGFQCLTCCKRFRMKAQLDAHKSKVHIGQREHVCDVEGCGRAFFTQPQLARHKKLHFDKKYKCSFCDLAFCERSRLKNHERIHTGEKPYICAECGAAFRTSESLRHHRNKHYGVLRRRSRKATGKVASAAIVRGIETNSEN